MCTGTVFIIAHIPQHRPDRDVLKRGSEVSDVRCAYRLLCHRTCGEMEIEAAQ